MCTKVLTIIGLFVCFFETSTALSSINFILKSRECEVTDDHGEQLEDYVLDNGSDLTLYMHSDVYVNNITCHSSERKKILSIPGSRIIRVRKIETVYKYVMVVDKRMKGISSCDFFTHRDIEGIANQQLILNGPLYKKTTCSLNITVHGDPITSTISPTTEKSAGLPKNQQWIFIAVGVAVAIIIAVQTCVILYFKRKARKMARMRRISQRASTLDRPDKKRYITASTRAISSWLSKNRQDDGDIYETLEETRAAGQNTPPVPPIETIPNFRTPILSRQTSTEVSTLPKPETKTVIDTDTFKKREQTPDTSSLQRKPAGRETASEADISTRPPLPLPTEMVTEALPTPMNPVVKQHLPKPMEPIQEASPKKSLTPALPQNKELKPVPSVPSTLRKPKVGQVSTSVLNELDSKLKLRSGSLATAAPPTMKKPDLKTGFPSVSFLKKHMPKKDAVHVHNFAQAPVDLQESKPNPMPSGKSAIILGLAPPKPIKPKPSVLPKTTPPPASSEPLAPSKPSTLPKIPPVKPVVAPLKSAMATPPSTEGLKPAPIMKKPALPTPVIPVVKQPLPTPKEPIQEPVYEVYNEIENTEPVEDIYNSDEEWTYEPLTQFNIYSS